MPGTEILCRCVKTGLQHNFSLYCNKQLEKNLYHNFQFFFFLIIIVSCLVSKCQLKICQSKYLNKCHYRISRYSYEIRIQDFFLYLFLLSSSDFLDADFAFNYHLRQKSQNCIPLFKFKLQSNISRHFHFFLRSLYIQIYLVLFIFK